MAKYKTEHTAEERIKLIMPLLDPSLDPAKKVALRKQLAAQSGLNERTLRRYEAAYLKNGFTGLKPQPKQANRKDAIPKELVEEAITLRREVPSRSVRQIIQILEWEGKATPGQIPRSTLQDHLTRAGYSSRTMRAYQSGGVAARRFQAAHRNDLWHSDIKYGPVLAIGEDNKFKQVYLVVFLDDATRYVLHAAFYDSLDHKIVKDAFKESLIHHGVPKAVYFDNGKQYRNGLTERACSKLGIRRIFAAPYSPEGTGKVEKFNQQIDTFLAEAKLDKAQTLEELNRQLWVWLNVCYQHKSHSALPNQISPDQAYRSDTQSRRFADLKAIHEAFLHSEQRRVDKSGCISLKSKLYEVGPALIGTMVNVVYDPSDLSEITIESEHCSTFTAKELLIGTRTGKRPMLPERLQPLAASHSRVLKACAKESAKLQETVQRAISYSSMLKAGE